MEVTDQHEQRPENKGVSTSLVVYLFLFSKANNNIRDYLHLNVSKIMPSNFIHIYYSFNAAQNIDNDKFIQRKRHIKYTIIHLGNR